MGTWNWWQLLAVVARDCATPTPLLPAHTWLMQRCRPQNGRRLLVNVARLASSSFSLFFVIPLPCPSAPWFFCFCFIFSFFFLLCLAAALFLARVPFCAYAILVYLLAILLAMNLFVFIVKPAAELPQNTNKQRPTSAAAAPRLPCLALKACRLARTELLVSCFAAKWMWFIFSIMKVTRTALASGFRLPRLCLKHLNLNIFSMLWFIALWFFHVPTLMWVVPEWLRGMAVWGVWGVLVWSNRFHARADKCSD